MNTEQYKRLIRDYYIQHGYTDIPVISKLDDTSLKMIADLVQNKSVTEPVTRIQLCFYGLYYSTKKEYEQMKKYYLLAIEKGDAEIMCELGIYYFTIEKDYTLMKKYFFMAIRNGNRNGRALYNLALYYQRVENNYKLMKKYYLRADKEGCKGALYNLSCYYRNIKDYRRMKKYGLMAINRGSVKAMNNLGCYYDDIEDYEQMQKYYLMAIKQNYAPSMFNLGLHYERAEKNYELAKKYYLMAIERGCRRSMYNLGLYYTNTEKDYQQMKKYHLMAAEKGLVYAVICLDNYYQNNKVPTIDVLTFYDRYLPDKMDTAFKYLTKHSNYSPEVVDFISKCDLSKYSCDVPEYVSIIHQLAKTKLDLLETHFKYMPGETGYQQAKKDYLEQIV